MIFWEKLKIQNGTVTITATAAGTAAAPILNFGDSTLKAKSLDISTGFTLPSGTSFTGAITLPTGSSISGVINSTQLTINNASITNIATISNAAITTATIATATITSLGLTNPINLPAGSSVNGKPIIVTENTPGFFICDGHFGGGNDWVNVLNGTSATYYVVCKLFKSDGVTEYVVDNSPIQSGACIAIAPATTQEILNFRDYWDDPFVGRENGKVKFYYATQAFLPADAYGTNPPSYIKTFTLTGAQLVADNSGVYQVIADSGDNSGVQTVLSKTDQMLIAAYQLGTVGNNDLPSNDDVSRLLGFALANNFASTDFVGFTSYEGGTGTKFKWYTINYISSHSSRRTFFTNAKAGIVWFAKAA